MFWNYGMLATFESCIWVSNRLPNRIWFIVYRAINKTPISVHPSVQWTCWILFGVSRVHPEPRHPNTPIRVRRLTTPPCSPGKSSNMKMVWSCKSLWFVSSQRIDKLGFKGLESERRDQTKQKGHFSLFYIWHFNRKCTHLKLLYPTIFMPLRVN